MADEDGFIMLETVVLSVLLFLMVGAGVIFMQAGRLYAENAIEMDSCFLAQRKLAELVEASRTGEVLPSAAETVDENGRTYTISVDIMKLDGRLSRAVVKVKDNDSGTTAEYERILRQPL